MLITRGWNKKSLLHEKSRSQPPPPLRLFSTRAAATTIVLFHTPNFAEFSVQFLNQNSRRLLLPQWFFNYFLKFFHSFYCLYNASQWIYCIFILSALPVLFQGSLFYSHSLFLVLLFWVSEKEYLNCEDIYWKTTAKPEKMCRGRRFSGKSCVPSLLQCSQRN